jgi:hypothetical protein
MRLIKCRLTGAVLGKEPMYPISPELRWTLPISQADLTLAEACCVLFAVVLMLSVGLTN